MKKNSIINNNNSDNNNPNNFICRNCKQRVAEDYYLDLYGLGSAELLAIRDSGKDYPISFKWLCNECGTEQQRIWNKKK